MGCFQCELLQSIAIKAARAFHDLTADLECAHLVHDSKTPTEISIRLKAASVERDYARAELILHENTHALKKSKQPLDRPWRMDHSIVK